MSKSKSKITEYSEYCIICGVPATDCHHLLTGSDRKNADADGLYVNLCRDCHNFIHRYPQALTMSKIIGQLAYEREHTREEYLNRYRHSYL